MKVNLVSLGCARNLIDSEVMLGKLSKAGWLITQDPNDAETIIVNTCSFIESAVNESIDTILELAQHKEKGNCKRLIVTGCLPERYREEVVKAIPEVDIFLGTGAFDKIIEAVNGSLGPSVCLLPHPDSLALQRSDTPRVQSSCHIAYLKIAEGCSKHCNYCIIPKLRGKQKSRSLEDIVVEAQGLIQSGAKELVLIAQDTTAYGADLTPPVSVSRLLERLSDLSNGKDSFSDEFRIRLMYGHPESIDDSVIQTITAHKNICSYFDIPIQHASNRVLKRMGRKYTHDDLHKLIDRIRTFDSDAAIRTTVILGFPGESDNDFKKLLGFIEDVRFDHLGSFTYSDSEDLPSHKLSGRVPIDIIQARYDLLMSRQAEISLETNRKYQGQVVNVLVEEALENSLYAGRTRYQAPEVDGMTYVHSADLKTGCFADVRIRETLEYDLIGDVI
jgi:ribosomal protein S12 methylthiotransferase